MSFFSCRMLFKFIAMVLFGIAGFTNASAQNTKFKIALMPDPQYYSVSDRENFNLYEKQALWLRDNYVSQNIKHVIWLGDLTNSNKTSEWTKANPAYNTLDLAGIPYSVLPGNHDYCTAYPGNKWTGVNLRDLSLFNAYLGPLRFKNKAWYGGNKGETTTKNENNYTFLSTNGMDFLIVCLEFGPTKETLTWANNLIAQHPNHRVILATHGYTGTNGAYVGNPGGSYCGTVGASGADIYDELVKRHSNVFMIACGHVTESYVNTRTANNGNTVYEMVVDYQGEIAKGTSGGKDLGNGWFRLLEFDTATNKINATTLTVDPTNADIFTVPGSPQFYISKYGSSPTGSRHQFSLNYNMTAPIEPYSYVNTSSGFHQMSVGGDLLGNQLKPSIGQADNGDWAVAWQDDSDKNGIFTIAVRGFDPDGNVRFNTVTASPNANSITATSPSLTMAKDGRFVLAWQANANQIFVRPFNADGTPTANPTVIQTKFGTGKVQSPAIAMSDSGNYVVVWEEDTDGDGQFEIMSKGFTFAGTERSPLNTVNTVLPGQQTLPQIAMAGNGDYVVVWQDKNTGDWDVSMRGFFNSGAEMFSQRKANTSLTGPQLTPAVAMNDAGNFVVSWGDDYDMNNAYQVLARGFNNLGNQRFAAISVNVSSTRNQITPWVAMDNADNWYPTWEDNGLSAEANGFQIGANVLDKNNARQTAADSRVNPVAAVTAGYAAPVRKTPVVSAHKSGRYIVAWADDMDGDGNFQILARGMSGNATTLAIKSPNGTVNKIPNQPFYAPGTNVTLTQTPKSGLVFGGWAGDLPSGTNPMAASITVPMDSSRIIEAKFVPAASVLDWQLFY